MSIAATLFFWISAYVTTALAAPVAAQAICDGAATIHDAGGVSWTPDCELGAGFVQTTLRFPDDYDGKVTSTVVRNDPPVSNPRGAVLYIHGFLDYFFQAHVAERFVAEGYDFYALDLRKYGRSIDGAAHMNFCRSMEEYFPEIDAAIDIITRDHPRVILYAHSTGALPATLYAADVDPGRIERLILNSPFLDFKQHWLRTAGGAGLGRLSPFREYPNPVNRWYARSLHRDYRGEWSFNTDWKPIDGAVAFFGWVNCVRQAHQRIAGGLDLQQPILVLHSDQSSNGGLVWRREFQRKDLILDVEDIRRLSGNLGPRVQRVEIPGAVHDVVLSRKEVREHALSVMMSWLAQSL
jgi:alpha-beta hydrolase superfamily lysophospholipase